MINQVSPFSSFTNFFKPVYSDMDASYEYEGETFSCLRESINLFDFGQRGYTLLPEMENNSLVFVEREGSSQSWSEIAIRIAKIATIIIPLLKLVGAAIYFLANDFQLQASEDTEDAEDTDSALVEHTFIQIEKTTTPVFDLLNEDLIRLFFKYLGPACFQLASTDKRTYGLMSADPSLERYRIGRDALKQCFALEFTSLEITSHVYSEKRILGPLLRSLCAFDPQAAFKRAKLNNDLKYRVSELVLVSDAFAKFDEKKSLEVLEHAYKEIYSLGQRAKSLFGAFSKRRIECFDRLEALSKLIKPFVKKMDLEKANKILQEIQQGFSCIDGCEEPGVVLRECGIYVDYIKCREGLTIKVESDNISLNISRIHDLFEVFPEKAKLLVDDLLEFLDKFIEKFPEAKSERICLLLDLSEVLVKFEGQRACELAKIAMSEGDAVQFNDPEYHIKYVKILIKSDLIEAEKAINRAHELINIIEQVDFSEYISNILALSSTIKSFNKTLAEELALMAFKKIKNFSYGDLSSERNQAKLLFMASDASAVLINYNLELAVEMFDLVKDVAKIIESISENFELTSILLLSETLRKIAKKNFILATEMAEDFETPYVKLIALISVVQGIIAEVNLPGQV